MLADLLAALSFQAGYNTRIVLIGAVLLGTAAGLVGTFTLLRGRALVSDALGHATLPGVVLAFMAGSALGLSSRNLPLLLAGAAASGALAVWLVHLLSHHTRLTEDTAIAAVLGVSFGLGVVLLSVAQRLPTGGQAGLGTFILGQTAGMTEGEVWTMAGLAALAILASVALFKEFRLICFDPDFARGLGWPVQRLDLLLLGLVVVVTVAGLQTVGLVLVVAFLVIPPVAARFWSERLDRILLLAGLFGGVSGAVGAALSSALPGLPTGAVIVLVAGTLFLVSLLFAPRRGVLATLFRQGSMGFRLAVVKALADRRRAAAVGPVSPPPVSGTVALWLRARGLVTRDGALTARGAAAAERADRNLALWERLTRSDPNAIPDTALWGIDDATRVLPAATLARLLAPEHRA